MKTLITNNGLNIMNQTRADGTVQYWLGYFGLAYVPDENRESEDGSPVADPIHAGMTELTTTGDVIYNVFQGAMTPTGFDTDIDPEIGDSAASKLYNECMYSGSVISKFRYVLDSTGSNKLIVFESVNENGQPVSGNDFPYGLQKYTEYFGVGAKKDNGTVAAASELPVPAPLYYMGEPSAWDNPVVTQQSIDNAVNNVTNASRGEEDTPSHLITADTRIISMSDNTLPQPSIDESTWEGNTDKYSYSASEGYTYGDPVAMFKYLPQAWQYQSVSNFNRFHGAANANGNAVNYEPACRNMSLATRLFPISHYDVINTLDDNKVENVKYTIQIDLRQLFTDVTRNSTVYYKDGFVLDPNDAEDQKELNSYRLGFKFNRIGIYAVPVALHAYKAPETSDNKRERNKVQMQIAGNSKPKLFAVMDLDSPVVLSENGTKWYDVSFQIDVVDTGIVDDAGIYYNLYESDAITWYKNQLIANASAAEAVTTLGVEVNYLRQQIADMANNNSACGMGDDGDRYALVGHTHNYLKNIVDSVMVGNGAVRGVYTQQEDNQITVYKRNGRILVRDENDPSVVRYEDDPTSTAPKLMDSYSSIVGDYSMGLGTSSATMGRLSVNMSDNGILGPATSKILLMGERHLSDPSDDLNEHICIEDSSNSIIMADDTAEIEQMYSSLWIGSEGNSLADKGSFVDHAVKGTIGIGRISVYNTDRSELNPLYRTMVSTPIAYNMLSGGINMYGWAQYSLIFNDGWEFENRVDIGRADIIAAINADATYSGTSTVIDSGVEGSGIRYSLVAGSTNTIGRKIYSTINLGTQNHLHYDVKNSIIIGDHNNSGYSASLGIRLAPQRMPQKIMTVAEFNAKYSTTTVADDDHAFDRLFPDGKTQYDTAIVVGDGTISAMSKTGSVNFTREVHGACLYISYERYILDTTTGQYVENPNADWSCSYNPQESTTMLTSTLQPGNRLANMLMIGNYNNPGQGSRNTIIIGNECTSSNITYANCFINDAESPRVQFTWESNVNHPSGRFNNVWWIGHQTATSDPADSGLKTSGDSYRQTASSNFITARWMSYSISEFSDVFAFVGRNPYQYGYADWYGAANKYNTGWSDYSASDLYQPCKAPMIYSGGIALGGYGTADSNFMLMKIGMRGCWDTDLSSSASVSDLIEKRGGDHIQNMYTPDLNNVRNIVYLQDDQPTSTPDKVVNANGTFDLYDNYCSDGVHHLQVDSPFAGMALVVQDKQELDGTLHVGLGNVSSDSGSGTGAVYMKIPTDANAYVSFYDTLISTLDISTSSPEPKKQVILYDPLTEDSSYTYRSTYWTFSKYDGTSLYFTSRQNGIPTLLTLTASYTSSGSKSVSITRDLESHLLKRMTDDGSLTYENIEQVFNDGYIPYIEEHVSYHGHRYYMLNFKHLPYHKQGEPTTDYYFEFQCVEGDRVYQCRVYNRESTPNLKSVIWSSYIIKTTVPYTSTGAETAWGYIQSGTAVSVYINSDDVDELPRAAELILPYTGTYEWPQDTTEYVFSKVVQEPLNTNSGSSIISRLYKASFTVTINESGEYVVSNWGLEIHYISAVIDRTDILAQNWTKTEMNQALADNADIVFNWPTREGGNSDRCLLRLSNIKYTGVSAYYVYSAIISETTPAPESNIQFKFVCVEYDKTNGEWGDRQSTYITSGGSGGATIDAAGSPEQPVYFSQPNTVTPCSYGISADANGQSVGVIYFR